MDPEWLQLEGPPSGGEVWDCTQGSELQCLACLHSELGGNLVSAWWESPWEWPLPWLEATSPCRKPHTESSPEPRLRSGGPHVLLQAQSGTGGRWVMFTLHRPHVLRVLELLLLVVVPLGQDVEQ